MLPSFARRFLRHLRAGAVAAGGSLYGLAGAVALSRLAMPSEERMLFWLGVSLVSVGLAVRFGHRTPAGGAAVAFGRTLSALLLGGALVAALVVPIAVTQTGPVAGVAVIAVAATAMLLAAYFTRHAWQEPSAEAPQIEPPAAGGVLPAAPHVEVATSYGLAATGPALTSEESEREARALEVRLLWGEDLLRVEHLMPPRSVHAGEAADIPLGHDLLGADHASLVVVEGESIRAVVPPGAKALVDRSAGGSAAIEGAGGGESIPLALGTRVTLSFSARAASAYRATGAEAPVVVEVALVRAGRVVGRGLRLGDAWRPILACLLPAAAAAAALLPDAMKPPAPIDDGVSVEQVREMMHHMWAVAEREEETPPEPRPIRSASWYYEPYLYNAFLLEEGPYAATGFDIQPSSAALFCANLEESDARGWNMVPSAFELYCASRVMTPFGLRGVWQASPDLFGRDPKDLWPFKHPRAARATNMGAVRLGPTKVSGRLPPEVVERMMRQNMGRLRLCYGEGLARAPTLAGRMAVRLVIGRDGAVSVVSNGGSDLPDSLVVSCAVETFRGLSFPAPEGGIVIVTQAMTFGNPR